MLVWMWAAALAGEPAWSELSSASGWSEVASRPSDVGKVTVYHKEIGGVPCLQGVTTSTQAPEKLLAVVMDIPSSTRWSSADVKISETLATTPSGAVHYWQYLDVPNWTMVYDRYWVLEGRASTSGDLRRFRWTKLDSGAAYPAVVQRAQAREAGAVEPPVNWGEWTFQPKGGVTEVQYRACADVGGKLPLSIQQWVASRTLPDTVADVIREAGRR